MVVVEVVVPRRRPIGDCRIRSTLVSFTPSWWRARLIIAVRRLVVDQLNVC